MAKENLTENIKLKQELKHAESLNVQQYETIKEYKEFVDSWQEAYRELEEAHLQVVESKKRHIKRIQRKARSNPWPWVLSGVTLILGVIVGKLL